MPMFKPGPINVYVDDVDYAVALDCRASFSGRNFAVSCKAGNPSNSFLALMVWPLCWNQHGQLIQLPFGPCAVPAGDPYSLLASVPFGNEIRKTALMAVACWAWGAYSPIPIALVWEGNV